MTPEEEISRANEAASVLGNQVYQEAMMIIRGNMMATFQATSFDQTDERDEIWRQMQVVDWLEKQLNSVMSTGKLATKTQEMNDSQQ